MKRFFLVTIAASALLVPSLASAEHGPRLVYRPELRSFVVAPSPSKPVAPASTLTPGETIVRHENMARGYRVNPGGRGTSTAAAHCDRMIREARERARKVS